MRRGWVLWVLLLAGCTVGPPPDPRAPFLPLVGQPEAALIAKLGVPTRTYTLGATTYLAYDSRRVDVVPGYWGPGWGPWWGGPGGYWPPQAIRRGCEVDFSVVGGVVKSVRVVGGPCD